MPTEKSQCFAVVLRLGKLTTADTYPKKSEKGKEVGTGPLLENPQFPQDF